MAIDFQPDIQFEPENTTQQSSTPSVGDYVKNTVLPDALQQGAGMAKMAYDVGGGLIPSAMPSMADLQHPVDSITGKVKEMAEPVTNFKEYTKQHPVSQAMNIAGLASGLGGAFKEAMPNLIPDSVMAKIPDFLNKLTEIPTKATERKGYLEKAPTQNELQTAIQNVRDVASKLQSEIGGALNKTKADAGIPTDKAEMAASVRKYGNLFNLDTSKPLQLPKQYSQNAPEMSPENTPLNPLKIGDEVTATHPDKPPVKMVYKMPGMMVGINDPAFDLKEPVPNPNASWSHPIDSTLSKSTLESYGYKVPEGTPAMQAEPSMAMAYKLGDHSKPETLMTEIERFKANQDYIAPKDRIKAASYLQDQIQSHVDWDKSGDRLQGTLKQQYGDLKQVVHDNSPELQAQKTKMEGLYDAMDGISSKLNAGPGQAEAYLRKLFTSDSPAYKDDLTALAKIDKLAGTNTLDTLFQKFAGEEYGKTLSKGGIKLMKRSLPYAIGSGLFGHGLVGLGGEAAEGATTSPKVIGAIARNAPKIAGGAKGLAAGLQLPFQTPQMQSLRDRLLNNANNQ